MTCQGRPIEIIGLREYALGILCGVWTPLEEAVNLIAEQRKKVEK